jgi:outer membrane protein TolC
MASLEVTKDMRARMTTPVALLLGIALAAATPAAAQTPSATTPQAPATAPTQPTPPAAEPAASSPGPELRLSLDEAVQRALDNNNDIAVARYDPDISGQDLLSARGYYDPYLFANLNHNSTDSKGTSAFSGGTAVNNKTDTWNFGVALPVQTGANLSLAFNNNKQDTNNAFSTYNPVYNSSLALRLTQPLLKNFKVDSARYQIRIAKKNREISDVQFHQTIVNTVATVKGYYYDLIYAFDNLAAAQKNLDLAGKLLDENQIRVKVGTMAPLDVVSAQSEQASREVDVITAENYLAQAQDNLKQVIFAKNDPAMWATQIMPIDRPGAEPVPVDTEAAVRNALANRTDVVAARKNLERSDLSVTYYKNQMLPQLDLVANYGGAGAGGTLLVRDPALGGPVVSTVPGGYGDALSDVFGVNYPTWTIGANVSYYIPNRTAKAQAASARLSRDQALASFRRLELQVAAEVRTAARGVLSGFKTVESTKAARVLADQSLDAEEKKFAAGMSTNYFVTQRQRDLALARVNELAAISNYHKSLVNFQRVQEAGVSGSGTVAVLSTGGSSAQATQAVRSSAAAASATSTSQ